MGNASLAIVHLARLFMAVYGHLFYHSYSVVKTFSGITFLLPNTESSSEAILLHRTRTAFLWHILK